MALPRLPGLTRRLYADCKPSAAIDLQVPLARFKLESETCVVRRSLPDSVDGDYCPFFQAS